MTEPASREIEAFRIEARDWLEANLPPSLRADPSAVSAAMVDGAVPTADVLVWRRRMAERGWGVPTWPRRYGGGGLNAEQAQVLAEEMARIDARNPIGGLGVMMFGPTLLEFGDEAQLARHIPPIAAFEQRWCQGFSEPGAGSDLASLQTRAIDRGDHFQVTGQKLWTTGGQYADWCFCLVRTDPDARKHDGISFLLIDMRSPGVEVRPLTLISGDSSFCEIFFTDVLTPKENLVGPLNGGWAIAKRLLQHERQATSAGASPLGVQSSLAIEDMARDYVGLDDAGRLSDGDLRGRITRHLMEARAFRLTHARAIEESRAGGGPSAASSILKTLGSEFRQAQAELTLELMGHRGLGWSGDSFAAHEVAATRTWLRGKSGSIAGGSNEIQNNIVAKRLLGLPDPT
ncbi:MAG: acyl-CoA dehydrogenase family protein [Phenylobacterium sp.]|nr:acyl-CoA dehydrogenase family protein [Phenylobacterium sp.]